MANCLIFTSYLEYPERISLQKKYFDYIICADGGYIIAEQLGFKPNLIIGDFDSSNPPRIADAFVVTLSKEKDITDTEAAVKKACEMGFTDITILGGTGGRLDHTLGNIGLLDKYNSPGRSISLLSYQNYVFLIENTTISIRKNDFKYLSVISHSNISTGVFIRGVKYPLSHADLTNSTTLGISNEITDEKAIIKVTNGKLLVILSKDIDK
ncbi:MAG: thiamine diphosphokinase [Eubacteriales bacterium]|nr:thiamine diphosphokinase [Eubacteriales bacterium]